MPIFRGAVLDDAGNAVNGASVDLYAADTTTPSVASDTTDSSGLWDITHATRGRFDVKITNGADVVWLRARDRFQIDMLQAESADNVPVTATRSEDSASVQVAIFEGDRATMADGDDAYISLRLSDDGGNQDEQARIAWEATTVAAGATQDGDLIFSALVNNTLTEMVRLDGSASQVAFDVALVPKSSDGAALGTGTLMWSDLFLASLGVINFNNGDVTITHGANSLAFAGATSNYTFDDDVTPDANDSAQLGVSGTAWSDLFLASGGVINFNAGDVTLTHGSNTLTVSGGDTHVADGFGMVIGHSAQVTPSGLGVPEMQVVGTGNTDASSLIARYSADATDPFLLFYKSRSGTAGTDTVVQSGDGLGTIVFYGSDGTTGIAAASIAGESDGTPGTNDMPGRILLLTTADGSNAPTERVRINSTGQTLINDTSNANVTIGLTINQGANDNEILAFKSSDTSHGGTDVAETDTYGYMQKETGATGGLLIEGFQDGGNTVALALLGASGSVDTGHTTAGTALVETRSYLISGTGQVIPSTADTNLFAVRAATTTKFIIDLEGDYHYDGADGGAFDAFDDIALVRAFDYATAPKQVIKSEWDGYLKANEKALIDADVLGAPIAEGGLVNGAQLARLHNGAIYQLWQDMMEVVTALPASVKKRLNGRVRQRLALMEGS